ncbi:heavy-metal-associated domain-containing protein [Aurantimonas coralicida]|uniref:heavy-metal-associated domain-containing protein n=1 Tax=Aurantimonas coralicida TaxID=182270 RepID=UPI001D192E0E|nr:heavy metal-associated domain-containing protein [Aurantimonas coralicida]MCC4298173.1 heavy-metal-associated domain-containing protein [Aurantimonas coralicida]
METTIEAPAQTLLNVPGMHCGSCARAIEKALRQVTGVDAVNVDARRNIAAVAGSAPAARLIAAVEAAGYEASVAERGGETVERQSVKSRCCCG